MQKMKLFIPLAVTAALVLAGCSGGAQSSNGASGSGEPLVVAFPVPLTSGNKATAEQMVKVAELAVKTINAEGGAGGRKLELKTYDDKLTADESAKVAQRALTVDGADVVMGGYTTIEGLAIREVTDRRKILYLATSTVSPQLTKDAKYTFRIAHDQGDYPTQIAQAAVDLKLKKPLVVHDDGASGATLTTPIMDALKAKSVSAGDPVGFTLNATDLSATVSSIAAQKADGIILVGSSAADAGLLVKTLAEQGSPLPIIGFSSPVSPDSLRIGGAGFDKSQVYSIQNKQPDKPLYREFVQKFAAEYGGNADELARTLLEPAGQTWDGFTLLKKALDATKGNSEGDKLAEAIRGIEPFEGAAGKDGSKISLVERPDAYKDSMVTLKLLPDHTLEALKP